MSGMTTSHLDLVPSTVMLLDAELESNDRLALLLDARVPASWPPGEYTRDAIRHFRACLDRQPASSGWYSWYALLRGGEGEPRFLVGAGGYFGPPDDTGLIEIGYSIIPEFEGKGYATELVRALVDRAVASSRVRRIIAHTNRENVGSVKVLQRSGFEVRSIDQETGTMEYEFSMLKGK